MKGIVVFAYNRAISISVATGLVSAIIAIAAFTFAYWKDRRDRHAASIRDRHQYGSDFRNWADRVIVAMSEAYHAWTARRTIPFELLYTLSALLNQGRLFLLNVETDTHENLEFPGYRPRILDCIYYTYRFIQLDPMGRNLVEDKALMFQLQARFVRDCQLFLALSDAEATMESLRELLIDEFFLDTSQTHPAIAAAKAATAVLGIDTIQSPSERDGLPHVI